MIRRILCSIDLEHGTQEVVRTAAALTQAFHASLILLYVVDSPLLTLTAGSGPLKLPEDEAEAVERATVRLQAQAQLRELAEGLHIPAEVLVLEGPPVAGRILEAIERLRPDLLVVGSHGRRGIRRLLVGSVCDKLVHASPVPVMVVKNAPEGWQTQG